MTLSLDIQTTNSQLLNDNLILKPAKPIIFSIFGILLHDYIIIILLSLNL